MIERSRGVVASVCGAPLSTYTVVDVVASNVVQVRKLIDAVAKVIPTLTPTPTVVLKVTTGPVPTITKVTPTPTPPRLLL